MTKAIVLAAGEGSRLRPYTTDRPKGMVEVNGKPILEYQYETLKQAGVDDIIVVCGYQQDKISSSSCRLIKIHNERWSTTNMVASLFCAKEWLNDDVIISYADIIYQLPVLKQLLKSEADITVSSDKEFLRYWQLRMADPLDDVESFSVNDEGFITSIGQKVESLDQIEAQYIGLMRFKGTGLEVLKQYLDRLSNTIGFNTMYMTDLLMVMIQGGVRLTPLYHQNGWVEIDTIEDLKLAERILQGKISI
ncbi:MAG: phosphocholine cytidylyltransferase family protein [Pseudomonadota bacterium]|nr:phosphocholine cytidylyltransferase family protein [Pseudomonadota bacterium]